MKRFVWRLQKVLDVKTKQEQLRRVELFRLTEELAQKRTELLLRQGMLRDIMADIAKDTSPRRLGAQEFFLRHTAADDAQIRGLQGQIADLEVRQQQKTAEVLAARRYREGLEKLRVQAREKFIREQEKLEQKESDGRTTMAFARDAYARMMEATGSETHVESVGHSSPVVRNEEHKP
jgi:flagellar biosynthesis chaperone FliJ